MKQIIEKHVKNSAGSALILTVVLTSLLAIIGMMFVMAANMDRFSSSSASTNQELNSAVNSVVAEISHQLILDVPGEPNAEYYDYPGPRDSWLANLEPDSSNKWKHISDLYAEFGSPGDLIPAVIPEHKTISLNSTGHINRTLDEDRADADGDGVADSRWTELRVSPADANKPVVTKSGKHIYAAIRIIDNGAMLNANTGYIFDITHTGQTDPCLSDGSNQLQINFATLAGRPYIPTGTGTEETKLWQLRYPSSNTPPTATDFEKYKRYVVWHYEPNNPLYTPFDIGDELELRNRFLLNNESVDTRLEDWGGEFRNFSTISTPIDTTAKLTTWYQRVSNTGTGSSVNSRYSYRHLATTYNMDRIIDPNGLKMADVNDSNDVSKQDAIFAAIRKSGVAEATAAQITANLVDYCDNDSNVTTFTTGGTTYYGFERPCIYISELAYKIASWPDQVDPINNPPVVVRSFGIELFKPYGEDVYPDNAKQKWQLLINGTAEPINNWTVGKYHVVVIEDPLLQNTMSPPNPCSPRQTIKDEIDPAASSQDWTPYIGDVRNAQVELQREVSAGSNNYITVDSFNFPSPADAGLNTCISGSIERAIDPNKCVRHLWSSTPSTPTLGKDNTYQGDSINIPAHPANKLITIGEIGKILCKSPYPAASDVITPNTDTESTAKIDLTNPTYQRLLDYLTVLDPNHDGIDNDNDGKKDDSDADGPEWKIPGRININTAPWYVIAQLPWQNADTTTRFDRARKICDYRDNPSRNGFTNIGELMNVTEMLNGNSNTPFEQRDAIFSRLSNLVTVRSDVFTAYILVRLGADGPQKRVIAILDRSDVYPNDLTKGGGATGKVKIVALWPVPDAR